MIKRPISSSMVVPAAALAGLLFGFDTAVISGVVGPMARDLELGSTAQGIAVSSALVGTLVAALTVGVPGDRFGSRLMLRWVAGAFIISGVGCAVAGDLLQFALFRFIGGLAIGGASVLAPVFIAEVSPAARRGGLVGLFQLSIVAGILLAYVSNAAIGAFLAVADPWRLKIGVSILPGLVFLLAMLFVPNSPRWLASRGRTIEAVAVAEALHLEDFDPNAEKAVGGLVWSQHGRPIKLALMLASFNQLSGINAILYYLNDIFAAAGYNELAADVQAVLIGVANFLTTICAMLVIDRVGRRPLLLVGSVGTALALFGCALVFAGLAPESLLLWLLIIFIVFFAASQGAVIWVYLAEIFPTPVRARGQAIGSATHWAWAAVLSFGFPVLADRLEPAAPFWLFGAAMLVQFVVVWRFFPETKGISLEAMETALASRRAG